MTSTVAAFAPTQGLVQRASWGDTTAVFFRTLLPTIAKGVIIRRRSVLALAAALDLDRHALDCVLRLRDKYGTGLLRIDIPGRRLALVLDPADARRVLDETPDPFTPASLEKRAALSHFEPRGVLISEGSSRAERRRLNEEVLQTPKPVHDLSSFFLNVVEDEADRMLAEAVLPRPLDWDRFSNAWFRIVRRILFGDSAARDTELSIVMARLRSAANWAFLYPQRPRLRRRLLSRIAQYIEHADNRCLAGLMRSLHPSAVSAPVEQVPQWLFAFDPAGMTAFRTLALLAAPRDYARIVREEITGNAYPPLPRTQAAVLETLRLWPTTPLLLRDTTSETEWENGSLPTGTGLILYAPYFHRDRQLSYADRFAPALWNDDGTPSSQQQGLAIPFSDGPAACPGRNLVLLLTTAAIAAILRRVRLRLRAPDALSKGTHLPATLNHFAIRFDLAR